MNTRIMPSNAEISVPRQRQGYCTTLTTICLPAKRLSVNIARCVERDRNVEVRRILHAWIIRTIAFVL